MSSGAESCGMADPMLFVLANLKGSRVEILLNSGERYTGIFHAFSPDSMGIALRMARKADAPQTELPLDTFVVQFSDFSQIVAHDIALGGGQARNAGGFQTDSQISGQGYIERELTAWAPSADDATFGALGGGQQQGQWDQFQANRDLYGVKDTYDETLYTTKLDSKKFTSEQRAHAAKMAREIERQSSGNIHMQEERNQKLSADFAEMDEEDRYGAVVGTGRSKQQGGRSAADGNWRSKPSGGNKPPGLSTDLTQEIKQEASTLQPPSLAQPFYPSLADMDPSIVSWGPKGSAPDDQDSPKNDSSRTVEERHRVRQLLVQERSGHSSGKNSPQGSPALSPQPSPSLRALHLDPALGVLKGEARDEFYHFKEQEKNSKKAGTSTNGVQREQVTQRLKEFSNTLNKKDSGSSSNSPTTTSPTLAADPKPASTLKLPSMGKGLNPFASEFKLNVASAEFVPSFKKPAAPPAPPMPQQQVPPAPPAQQQPGYPAGFIPPGFQAGPAPQFQPQPALQVQGQMGPPMNVIEAEGEYTQEMKTYDLYANSMDSQVASNQLPPSHQTGAQWQHGAPQQPMMQYPGQQPMMQQPYPQMQGHPQMQGRPGQQPMMQYPGQQPMMQQPYPQMQGHPQMQGRPGAPPQAGQGQPQAHFPQQMQQMQGQMQPQMQMRQ